MLTNKKYSMKKATLIILCATLIACNKTNNTSTENKSHNVVWAEKVKTVLPLEKDSLTNIPYLVEWNKYDKKTIFESLTNAVLKGKLKAYCNYPDCPLTIEQFKNTLDFWDSTNYVEDENNPGTMMSIPIHERITAEDIVQVRFDEHIEFDTTNYTFNNKISVVEFLIEKKTIETGEVIGLKYLFGVKLDDASMEKK